MDERSISIMLGCDNNLIFNLISEKFTKKKKIPYNDLPNDLICDALGMFTAFVEHIAVRILNKVDLIVPFIAADKTAVLVFNAPEDAFKRQFLQLFKTTFFSYLRWIMINKFDSKLLDKYAYAGISYAGENTTGWIIYIEACDNTDESKKELRITDVKNLKYKKNMDERIPNCSLFF